MPSPEFEPRPLPLPLPKPSPTEGEPSEPEALLPLPKTLPRRLLSSWRLPLPSGRSQHAKVEPRDALNEPFALPEPMPSARGQQGRLESSRVLPELAPAPSAQSQWTVASRRRTEERAVTAAGGALVAVTKL